MSLFETGKKCLSILVQTDYSDHSGSNLYADAL